MIDENLYSRQIAVYGKNEMKSMISSKVKVIGINGSSLELCKNLILSGIGKLCIEEDRRLKDEDLSTIYFAKYEDVGKPLTEVIKFFLKELNPSVNLLFNDDTDLYDTYVLSNNKLDIALKLNEFTRSNNLSFIWLNSLGLMGNVFCDFNKFTSSDVDGEELTESNIKCFTNTSKYVETIEPHNLQENDYVKISSYDLDCGLITKPKVTKILSPYKFILDSELNFHIKSGKVLKLKKSSDFFHKSLSEQYENPNIVNLDCEGHKLHEIFKNYHSKIFDSDNEFTNKFRQTVCGEFLPICSILGSYAAHEVIKSVTKKFSPTSQWYYHHCYDILPTDFSLEFNSKEDKLNGLRKAVGSKIVDKLVNTSIFIVGSGAIGCEHLKNFSMCGFGSGDSKLVITDMDSIEKSNLSRQFLFRNNDIGKMKSEVACNKIKEFNNHTNITSKLDKLCKDTENIYDKKFFDSIDIVANALDNVEARLYMDKRCIYFNKPLFECGTLGSKGNTQVIIPKLTEHYGAARDPQEKSIPVCTLKNFPNSIDHTIHWARNEFEELFTAYPSAFLRYKNNENLMKEIHGNEKGEVINAVSFLFNNMPHTFSDCIKFSINRFYEKYNHQIKNLLNSYPENAITSSGAYFWSEGKVCPRVIDLDLKNKLISEYIYHCSMLFAEMFNIEVTLDYETCLMNEIKNYIPKDFESQVIHVNEKDQKEYDNKKISELNEEFIPNHQDIKNIFIKEINFEKDNDDNHHIDFIHCSSNLRASNYRITLIDKYNTKIKAGKIVPAVATTTSIISGLVTVEIIKYVLGITNIESFKNYYLNLSLSLVTNSEPFGRSVMKIKDKDFDIWDYYNQDKDILVSELLNNVSKYYCYEIDTLIFRATLLISPMTLGNEKDKRMNMKISELLKYFNIDEIEEYEFQIDSLDTEDEVNFPNIKFIANI